MLRTLRRSAAAGSPRLAHRAALVLLLLPAMLLPGMHAASGAEPAADTAPAAEAATDETTATGSGEDAGSTAGADSSEATNSGSLDGEGFVPSVQISEDLSVSFPTDI